MNLEKTCLEKVCLKKACLEKIYREEDLFPREITSCEEREYGYLFYNEENKDSYDSNHVEVTI